MFDLFFNDAPSGHGVLQIGGAHLAALQDDGPLLFDPRANPVIMIAPGDGPPLPPDPRSHPVIMIAPGDGTPLPPDPK